MKRLGLILLGLVLLGGAAGGVAWGVRHFLDTVTEQSSKEIPTTTVRKGEVVITVSARGELQGGNSESLIVPMAGVGDIPIISLRSMGELVKAGDVVVEFDTTQQEYNLREAEADFAEAQQKVLQAESEAKATLEEGRLTTVTTAGDVKLAEWEVRKNPTLAANVARQNEISLQAARNRQTQAEGDFKNNQQTSGAGLDIQRANANKFKLLADNAKKTIDSMVLRAKSAGYVYLQTNTNGVSIAYNGMVLPNYQVGDTARAGQTVALIPDMSTWELSASVPEVDRGYLMVGQQASVQPAALAGKELKGHVKTLGGTTGSAWSRKFDARIQMDQIDPMLRPGMSANVQITVEKLKDVLWVPSQAVFESDGHTFLYVRSPEGFVRRDIKLVRRGESQTAITGLEEGQTVALSAPDQADKSAGSGKETGVMKALTK